MKTGFIVKLLLGLNSNGKVRISAKVDLVLTKEKYR